MKAYCINLDRRPDRLAHIAETMARIGLPYIRVTAVDGEDPEVAAAAAACPTRYNGRPLSRGAYACFLSHREVWKLLVRSGDRYAMILEDDIEVAPDLARYLDDSWVPADAAVVKIETFLTPVHRTREPEAVAVGRSLTLLRSRHAGCAGYVISRDCAERLLRDTETLPAPVDEYIFGEDFVPLRSLRIYQMTPAPVMQANLLDSPTEGWRASSIVQDQDRAHRQAAKRAERALLFRVRRKVSNIAFSLTHRTRYEPVPFG